MANPHLKGRHGVCLYSAQVSHGTPVTPATAAGICSFRPVVQSGVRPVYTIGSATPLVLKPGMNVVTAQVGIEALQTSALLIQGVRTSGALPELTWGWGFTRDDATHFAWEIQDAKIGSWEVSIEGGNLARASLAITGGLETDLTTLVKADLVPTPMYSYEGVITKGGAAYPVDVKSLQFSVNHNLSVDYCVPGVAPATFKRGFTRLTEGNQEVTGSILCYDKSGDNMMADTIAGANLVLTFTDIVGGMTPNTITMTLTGMKFNSEGMDASPGGDFSFPRQFTALDVQVV